MSNTHCPACRVALAEGEAAMRCPLCGLVHHRACWERAEGCAVPLCGARVSRDDGALSSTRCHRCRGDGATRIRYYYGRMHREWPDPQARYDIAGESEVWLCDRCLGEGRGGAWAALALAVLTGAILMPLGLGTAVVASGYWRAGYSLDPPLPLVVVGGLLIAAAMPAMMLRIALTRPLTRRRAARLALIRHARRVWRHRGFAAILTPEEHARLQAQGRVREIRVEM